MLCRSNANTFHFLCEYKKPTYLYCEHLNTELSKQKWQISRSTQISPHPAAESCTLSQPKCTDRSTDAVTGTLNLPSRDFTSQTSLANNSRPLKLHVKPAGWDFFTSASFSETFLVTASALNACFGEAAPSDGWWNHRLTSEVVPGVGRQAGVFVLSAVVPGGRALPGTLGLHLDHQGNPLLLVSCS